MKVERAALFAAAIVFSASLNAWADPADRDMRHCVDDVSMPADNIIASCKGVINDAYAQSWGEQYIPEALYDEAKAYWRKGEISSAQPLLYRAVKMEPELFRAWRLLLEISQPAAESELDAKAVDLMLAANPNDANVLNEACWVRATKGQNLDAAMADCNQALILDQTDANIWDSRCLLNFKMGAFADAVSDCSKAIRLEPKEASSFYVGGIAKLRLRMTEAGNADIASAKAMNPKISDEFFAYGVAP